MFVFCDTSTHPLAAHGTVGGAPNNFCARNHGAELAAQLIELDADIPSL